jgi:hypothetical protein
MKLFIRFSLWTILFSLAQSRALVQAGNDLVLEADTQLLAIGHGSAWVWNPIEAVVEQVNLTTGRSTDIKIPLPVAALNGSIEAHSLWILSDTRDSVVEVDLTTYESVATIDVSAYFEAEEFVNVITGEGTVWLKGEQTVLQIDPQLHVIRGDPIQAGEEIIVAIIANGELWTGSHDDGLITRIDLQTHEILSQFELGFSVHGLAVGTDWVWVLDEHDFAIVQVDLQSNQPMARIPIEFVGSNIAVVNDNVWVAPAAFDSGQPTNNDALIRIDPQTSTIVEAIHVGKIRSHQDGYYLILVEEGEAWVVITDDELTTLVRLSENE